MCISAGVPICLAGSALRSDHAEVQAEVDFVVMDSLFTGPLLEELIDSLLLRSIMLILWTSLFASH
jgi:hypothetical protein